MNRIRVLLLVLLVALSGCDGDQVRLSNGDPAPDFALVDLSGKTLRLSDLRGDVVAVRFWADWCRFCEGEMRALEPAYQRLRARGFHLLAVNVAQDRETARRFIDRLKITYPTLLDGDSVVTQQYGVIALPTTVLVDRSGRVRGKILGESDPATFESMVLALVNER